MKAAILHGAHEFRIETLPDPQVEPGTCLLDIKACGVCHSEIHQWQHHQEGLEYPRFIGHEVAGVVLETGAGVTAFKKGDRVAAWVDGKGYAEKVLVQVERLFPLADNIPFQQAMAEPIACTTNAVRRTNLHYGDTIAIIGVGFMGLILLQQIKLAFPQRLIAIDRRPQMLDLAASLGADMTFNADEADVADEINAITNGRGLDVVFEVGGSEATLNMTAALCRMEGKIVIFGFHPGARKINDLGWWNWMAFDIINAHFRDLDTILHGARVGMNQLNDGKINMSPLITHTFPLEEIEAAFQAALNKPKGFVKAVIVNP
jgi:threonine dehydrogenase-like Zn-dependent dehydrogenase